MNEEKGVKNLTFDVIKYEEKRIDKPRVLDELRMRARGRVKLIALDLDGTTLCGWELSRRTAQTLQKAIDSGIFVLVATGRAYGALPADVLALRGLKYVLTSNGAAVCDADTGKILHGFCIDSDRIDDVVRAIEEGGYNIEIFVEGVPYIDEAYFAEVMEGKHPYVSMEYIRRTRRPVKDIMAHLLENRSKIENINVHLPSQSDKKRMAKILEKLEGVTITTSHSSNLEIGGISTNKGNGVAKVCELLGLGTEQVMAFGDSPNDISMLEMAGFGIAMGNGAEAVLAAADYITLSSDEEGVAYAVEEVLL